MEDTLNKKIVYTGAVVIAALLIGLVITIIFNAKNKNDFISEKHTSDMVTAEKQKVEGERNKLSEDISSLKLQMDENTRLLTESKKKISESESRISYLNNENRQLRNTGKELDEMRKAKAELDNEYNLLKANDEKMIAQNKELQDNINSLTSEKNKIASELENAKLYSSDNFLVTATRGKKDKVVVCSSRTKKLNISFDVPQGLTQKISFKIITPTGSVINSEDKEVSWFISKDPRFLTADLLAGPVDFDQSRQVILNYLPKTKLVKGEYKIQLYCEGNNIGNCRIFLR